MSVCRKFPYEPQVREVLQTAEGIYVSELFLEDNLAGKAPGKTTLARNTEFLRELCPDMSDWSDFHDLKP